MILDDFVGFCVPVQTRFCWMKRQVWLKSVCSFYGSFSVLGMVAFPKPFPKELSGGSRWNAEAVFSKSHPYKTNQELQIKNK
jgi:hypothetical protein